MSSLLPRFTEEADKVVKSEMIVYGLDIEESSVKTIETMDEFSNPEELKYVPEAADIAQPVSLSDLKTMDIFKEEYDNQVKKEDASLFDTEVVNYPGGTSYEFDFISSVSKSVKNEAVVKEEIIDEGDNEEDFTAITEEVSTNFKTETDQNQSSYFIKSEEIDIDIAKKENPDGEDDVIEDDSHSIVDNLMTAALRENPKEIKTFKCEYCEYTTTTKSYLKRHCLKHKDPKDVKTFKVKTYKCEHCEYRTPSKSHMNAHGLQHKDSLEVWKFNCEHCEYQTVFRKHMVVHGLRHKDPKEVKTYMCELCDYTTIYKFHLKQHSLKHKDRSEVRTFKCEHCEFQTIRRGNLVIHSLRHKMSNEVQSFECEHCEYQTIYKSSLIRHCFRRHQVPKKN